MVFNSIVFVSFFFLFFSIYWFLCKWFSIKIRNGFILISSYIFYGWWDWRFLSLILFSTTVDYFIALKIEESMETKKKKQILLFSFIVNLSLLGFFTYFNFFSESLVAFMKEFSVHVDIHTLSIILPVGISFYTFQSLSYTIDVYRKDLKPTKDFIAFASYVSFFPQLVAGPIERAKHLLPQFYKKTIFSYGNAVEGFRLVLWGFFKKIVIADNLAIVVNDIFDQTKQHNSFTIFCGCLLFAFQIYCDFSGYSDIAVGAAKSLGFDIMKNFATPYFSKSLTEFWHRWHISLSSWFRDYVYFPLGGNKKKELRADFNLAITFLLSGLWHGANLTFLIWGGMHGLLLLIEKKLKKYFSFSFPLLPFIVFLIVAILWLPFRANNFLHLTMLIGELFQYNFNANEITGILIQHFTFTRCFFLSVVFVCFMIVEMKIGILDFNQFISTYKKSVRISAYYLLLLVILILGNVDAKPYFIYFQF
ncbi:MAG: MBOAT family protein, partial [Sphingobacteriales bacterium]